MYAGKIGDKELKLLRQERYKIDNKYKHFNKCKSKICQILSLVLDIQNDTRISIFIDHFKAESSIPHILKLSMEYQNLNFTKLISKDFTSLLSEHILYEDQDLVSESFQLLNKLYSQ